jgi:predicted 2-oxoglutarate/Fe(II)-dependent dioxygenase YbiX
MHTAWEWKSEIPVDVCDYIIKNFDNDNYQDGKIGNNNTYNNKVRNVQVNFKDDNWINALLVGYIRYANFANFHYDLSDHDKEGIQFSKYNEGCFYTKHTDYGDNDNHRTRKLSLSFQLSDESEYEGGELILYNHIQNTSFSAHKSKGSIIVFDSRIRHEVTTVTSGTRYSLVKWYHGDQPLK